jgi:hypothetical protein
VELNVSAVGEKNGEARLSMGLDTQNHIVTLADATSRVVPMQTLDQALSDRIPAEALRGARTVLMAQGLKGVLTENRSPSVVEMLTSAGMTEFAYDAFAHRLVPATEVPMANALFLRDPDHVADRLAQAHPVRVLGTMV